MQATGYRRYGYRHYSYGYRYTAAMVIELATAVIPTGLAMLATDIGWHTATYK